MTTDTSSTSGFGSDSGGGTTERAKETASTAADQGRHVAGTAKDQAINVAGTAAQQARGVVDDAVQQVSDVVRGADLLASTPRQIHLQQLLGHAVPSYLHVPVAINASGDKLSKQTRARALPDDAVDALLAAWRFLDQPAPAAAARAPAAFWQHALASWTPARLPPVTMLPAPSRFVA